MTEQWMPIPGYEGCYEVSDLGQVRSLDRISVRPNRWGSFHNVPIRGRVLRQYRRPQDGRPTVTLKRDGTAHRHLVYALVLTAFVGPRPDGMEACHNDGDASNSRLSNLRWDTPSANGYDKGRHGTDHKRNRTRCPRGHRLVAPNLDPAITARGHRNCLACARARKAKWKADRRGAAFDFDACADEQYERIMTAPATHR